MVITLSGSNGWNGSYAASHCVRLSPSKLGSDGAGFYPASIVVEVTRIIAQEADLPERALDLADADGLVSEYGRDVDLAITHADPIACALLVLRIGLPATGGARFGFSRGAQAYFAGMLRTKPALFGIKRNKLLHVGSHVAG